MTPQVKTYPRMSVLTIAVNALGDIKRLRIDVIWDIFGPTKSSEVCAAMLGRGSGSDIVVMTLLELTVRSSLYSSGWSMLGLDFDAPLTEAVLLFMEVR